MKSYLALFLIVSTALLGAPQAPVAKPNIVYILADDMGLGDVSAYNPKSAWRTPNMDRLAREGTKFTDAHSASGVCTPTRYALLTGRYSWRGKLKKGVSWGYDAALIEPGRLTVPALLRANGYTTGMVGKWHLGLDWAKSGPGPEDVDYTKPIGGGPLAHGFDYYFGIPASLDMDPYVYVENDRVTALPTGKTLGSPRPKYWRAGPMSPDFRHEDVQPRLTEKALEWLGRREPGQPFFLYFSLTAPHTPILPTGDFLGRTHTTDYGDFTVEVDAILGRVLALLDARGLAKNTLVILTADNGCSPQADLPALKKFNHDPSLGYRGQKADIFEGGHRIPFIVRWPGRTPAGATSTEIVGQFDLLATCADLLGVALPDDAGEDSVSLKPLLLGERPAAPLREAMINHSMFGAFSIRQANWKLCLCPGSGGWSFPRPDQDKTDHLPPFQLFDLANDPAEKNNLATIHPEIVQRLGNLARTLVERGRSTPGRALPPGAFQPWPELAWMRSFQP